MRKTFTLLAALVLVASAMASTIYTNHAGRYYIAAASWGSGGLPAQPSAAWRFCDTTAIDYDTIGTGANAGFRQYGSLDLTNELQLTTSPSFSEGVLHPHQSALSFNGVNDVLQSTDTQLRAGTNAFSIVTVVKISVGAGICPLAVNDSNSVPGVRGFALYSRTNDPYLRLVVSSGGAAYHSSVAGVTTDYRDGKFHVFGVTFSNGVDDSIYIYADGAIVLADKATTAIGDITSGNPFTVGKLFVSPDTYFSSATHAYLAYWNGTLLTAAQMSAVATSLLPTGTTAKPFPSLQVANDNGTAGDTILVQSGRYQETVSISRAFDYIGAVSTAFGSRPEFYGAALPAAAGTVGLTVSAKNHVGYLDIRGYSAAQGVLATATSDGSVFEHLTIDSCLYGVDFDGAAAGDSLMNCTIDGASLAAGAGFRATTSSAVTVVVRNCIFVNTATALTKAAAQTLTEGYNDFYGNTTNYAAALDATDKTWNPRFANSGGNDYRPRNSVLRNYGVSWYGISAPLEVGAWEILRSAGADGAGDPFAHPNVNRARKPWGRN